jgi:Tfp pilus assembly protein PilF
LNETDKAETYCKKLFAVNRENLRYIFVNGSLLFKKGKYEEASKEARKLITKNSEAGSGHCMLGRCLYMMNKTDSAGVEIKKAIAQDSTDHDALYFLACIESEKKNLIDALSYAYRALEYDSRYFECSLLIGRLYSMKHNEETAREFYDDAMGFNPKSALPHLFKAQSYIVSRQYELAADELRRIEKAGNYDCNIYETMLVNALLSDNGRETKSAFSALYNCDPAKTFFFTAFVDSNGIKNNNYNEDFLIKNNGISGMDHSLICRINEEEWRLKKDVANNDYSYPGRVGDLLRKTRSGNIKTSITDTIRLGNNYYINCSGLLRYKQQKLISINNWENGKYPELTAIIFDSRGQKICSILNGIIISGSDRIETKLLTAAFIVYEKNSNREIISLRRNPKSRSRMIDVSLDYYLPDGYRLLMTPVKSDKRINVFGEDNYFSGGGCLEIR